MNELLRTQRITFAVALFVIVIIIGLITLRKPNFVYKVSTSELIDAINQHVENEIIPEDAVQLYDDPEYIFIDVRNPYDFEKGHLPEAINIPMHDLLEKENADFFSDMLDSDIKVILYGADQLEANKAWMILYQIGFTNTKVLLGGYEYMNTHNPSFYRMPKNPEYFVEKAKIDYAEVMKSLSGGNLKIKKGTPKKVIPVRKTKKYAAEGGC